MKEIEEETEGEITEIGMEGKDEKEAETVTIVVAAPLDLMTHMR